MDLSPRLPHELFHGDGGSYFSWTNFGFPVLSEFAVGAGKLILHPRGFALSHYSDCSKIGYVVEGVGGVVGMVSPQSKKEDVLRPRKGDVIAVPRGVTSWWFNEGDSDFIMVFIGETSMAYAPGEFTYFLLSGVSGILKGFSTDLTSRILGVGKEEAGSLLESQKGILIVKLDEGQAMPQPRGGNAVFAHKWVHNIDNQPPDVSVTNGGHLTTSLGTKIPALGEVGLSARLVKLEPNALLAPIYTTDGATQVIYILKGSAKIQIVGLDGKRVLDTKVREDQLIVVPRFFPAAILASEEAMECFTMFTSSEAVLEELGGKNSVWEALSSEAIQASLNLTPEIALKFKSNIRTEIIIPPPSG